MSRGVINAVLSGFLLTLAFPRWDLWPLAWIALIPLFFALDQCAQKGDRLLVLERPSNLPPFLIGFSAGFTFFLLSISWLRHVTFFGMIFAAALEALAWGVFGVVYSKWRGGLQTRPYAYGLLLPAAWAALEFIRSEIPVWGFGWNLLGYSQASNLWIAQLASLGGVYLVSFTVLAGNLVIYSLIQAARAGCKPAPTVLRTVAVFAFVILAAFWFGADRIQKAAEEKLFRVTVLQGNIPQLLKWDPAAREKILKIYLNLTELAGFDQTELIFWPEAAYPGFFNRELEAEEVKGLVRKIGVPLVVGSPHQGEGGYYNSAYLLDRSGEAVNRYDKIRLVPFGETIPWKPVFGFLEPLAEALGVSDFSPGRELTVFELGESLPPTASPSGTASLPRFSTLLCFEDTFPGLAKKFVDRGADFLAVLTNDAWFGHSSAPHQHLQASVFRAIENGVSVVRAANSGVSAFISPVGEVKERVHDSAGEDTFVTGGMTYPVNWKKEKTLYRQGGWLFPYLCLAFLVIKMMICPPEGVRHLFKVPGTQKVPGTIFLTQKDQDMIPGFATPEGTERFRKRFGGKAAAGHFRQAGGLWLSSIGAGSYLGEADEATDRLYEEGLKEAVRSGVNVFDSAINYRCQRSERTIGRAAGEWIKAGEISRDELFLCSKGGFLPFDGEAPPDPPAYFRKTFLESGLLKEEEMAQGCHAMSPAFLEEELRRSLENFGVETLDLYYLHNPETQLGAVDRREFSKRLEAAFQFLEKKAVEGKIRCYGVATWDGLRNAPDQADHLSLEEMMILARGAGGRGHHFKAVQLPLNLAMPEAWIFRNQNYGANFLSLLETAQKLGVLVFASASLLQGRLAHVGDSPKTALQFARSCPGVVTALVGMKQPAHVRQNLGIAQIPPLTEEEMRNTFLKPVQTEEKK